MKNSLASLLGGHGCKKCANENLSKNKACSFEELKARIEHTEYRVENGDAYKTIRNKITFLHSVCGNTFTTTAVRVSENRVKCQKCYGKSLKIKEDYLDKMKEIYQNQYEVIELWKGKNPFIQVKGPCNHTYKVNRYAFLKKNTKCPECNRSKGEQAIYNFLYSKNILFEEQINFKKLKSKINLIFDFYIPKYNICIEFDGIQHFRPIAFFGGNDAFV